MLLTSLFKHVAPLKLNWQHHTRKIQNCIFKKRAVSKKICLARFGPFRRLFFSGSQLFMFVISLSVPQSSCRGSRVYFIKRTTFTSASLLLFPPLFSSSIPLKDWRDIEMENQGVCVFLLSKTHTCTQRPEPPESGVVTSVQRAGPDAGKAIQHNTAALSASSLTHFPLPGFLPFFPVLFLFSFPL